jgi:NTE family protein
MVANTRRSLAEADLVITPPLEGFGSLDWRRAAELAQDGYNATEAIKEPLLKLAVDEAEWRRYLDARAARRRTSLPVPASLVVAGATETDERRIRALLEQDIGRPLDTATLEARLQTIGGMDRYLAVHWDLRALDGQPQLVVQTRPKPYGPPFLMLSTTLQNTTNTDFTFQLAGRYLRFDLLGVGSELRLDAAVGSSPNLAFELYRPIGLSPFFVAIGAGIGERRLNFIEDDAIVAQYDQTRTVALADIGVNVSRISELRLGFQTGRLNAEREVGDPGLPSLAGAESLTRLRWIYDSQNDVVAPSTGTRAIGTVRYVFESPDLPPDYPGTKSNDNLGQMEIEASRFWSASAGRDRLFLTGGAGVSFHGHPLPTDQFALGQPFRLSAFDIGEVRGDHYLALTGGYLRGIGRMPDFIGGPVFLGAWLENGAAYESLPDAKLRTHAGIGAVLETLLGPATIGASFGFDGERRYYLGIGRIWP